MDCFAAHAAVLVALAPSSSSMPIRPRYRERLSLRVWCWPNGTHSFNWRGQRPELLIRSPGSLWPLTLCNSDCTILTAAMCSGLRRYPVECIHPSQRCVTQRTMIDNIFEIETAAICYSEDPGILFADFSCAYTSIDLRWIFMVLSFMLIPSRMLCTPAQLEGSSQR